MERLPQEILRSLVEGNESTRDLQAIRLVNKALAAAVTPYLFYTIPVWLSLRSLRRLTLLSEHSGLARHVHTIIISPLRLIDYEDTSAYEASVREWLKSQHFPLNSHELSVGRHMVAYMSYMEEQHFLTARNLDVKILSRALSGFTSLIEVNIDFWDKHIGARELMGAFGAFRCDDLLTQDCAYTVPVVFRALSRSTAEIKTLGIGYGEGINWDLDGNPNLGDAAFTGYALLASRHSSPSRPEETIVKPSYPRIITPQAMDIMFTSHDELGCKHALHGLRKLGISETSAPTDRRRSLPRIDDSLRDLIGFAPLLETIILKQMDAACYRFTTVPEILATHHLKHLRNLDLGGHVTTEQHLVDFFGRHSTTLVNVYLGTVVVTDSDWSSVLARLRDLTFPFLEEFGLDYLFLDCIYISAQGYILHRTDNDPIVEERERQEKSYRERGQ